MCCFVDFAVPMDHGVKIKENEKIDKYLNLAWEQKKADEHEGQCNTNCNWYTWNNLLESGKESEGIWNQWENSNQPD